MKNIVCFTILITALLGLRAEVIVSDDFQGIDETAIDGTQASVGGSWNGSSAYEIGSNRLLSTGTSNGHYIAIDLGDDYFVDTPGVYELSADVYYSSSMIEPQKYFSIGFTETTNNSPNSNRTHFTSTGTAAGTPAIALTGEGRLMVQAGVGELVYDSGVGAFAVGQKYTLWLELNTTGAQWTLDAYIDDSQIDISGSMSDGTFTYTYSINPTLRYVSVSSNLKDVDESNAYLDNFHLQTVTSNEGEIIVYDDFSGNDNESIDDRNPPIGGSWNGSSNFLVGSNRMEGYASGSGHFVAINMNDDYFILNPDIYELSAEIYFSSTTAKYFSIGFTEGTKNSENVNRTHLTDTGVAAGSPSIALAGDGTLIVQTEFDQVAYNSGIGAFTPGQPHTLRLVLDTRIAQWALDAYIDDSQIDISGSTSDESLTHTYSTNPILKFLSVSSNVAHGHGYSSYLDNFQLRTLSPSLSSELRVADIFTSHMVLQRDKPVPVWGWAEPGQTVTVSFDGQSIDSVAALDGKWMIELTDMVANANGQTMTVEANGSQVQFTDVLIGEVWIAAGQSNMNFSGPDLDTGVYPFDSGAFHIPDQLRVRRFGIGAKLEPVEDFPVGMRYDSPWEVFEYSTNNPLPYYFARMLNDKIAVPVGIVWVSVSGTNQTAWMSRETLEMFPSDDFSNYYQEYLAKKEDNLLNQNIVTDDLVEINTFDDLLDYEQAWLENPNGKWPGGGIKAKHFVNFPTALYNTRIHPLAPYAARGVIWHQGEGGPSSDYGDRLIEMFLQWREVFNQDLYVLWGTLSRNSEHQQPLEPVVTSFYRSNTNLEIREAYESADIMMDYVELYDLGDQQTHYKQKAEAGRRMGLAALDMVYGQDRIYTGPRATDISRVGGVVTVEFDHVGSQLNYVPSINGISGVLLIGVDGLQRWGHVNVINNSTITVSHTEITSVAEIYYAGNVNPHETLFNSDKLPASPFKHDFGGGNQPIVPNNDVQLIEILNTPEAELNLGHVRHNGFSFDFQSKTPSSNADVRAYIPSSWSGFEIRHHNTVLSSYVVTNINGQNYAEFSAVANDGPYAVIETGNANEFDDVYRY